jgi:hypothetical protein
VVVVDGALSDYKENRRVGVDRADAGHGRARAPRVPASPAVSPVCLPIAIAARSLVALIPVACRGAELEDSSDSSGVGGSESVRGGGGGRDACGAQRLSFLLRRRRGLLSSIYPTSCNTRRGNVFSLSHKSISLDKDNARAPPSYIVSPKPADKTSVKRLRIDRRRVGLKPSFAPLLLSFMFVSLGRR